MIIEDRLSTLWEEKNFSQGDIEERTGLLRCYVRGGQRPNQGGEAMYGAVAYRNRRLH
jgi:hypothetical protein